MLHGKFYKANLFNWDIMMAYAFMISTSAGALLLCATLICEAHERLSWLATHFARWTGEEEEKIVRSSAVKATGIKSKGSNGEHLQEYGVSWDACCPMMGALGRETPFNLN